MLVMTSSRLFIRALFFYEILVPKLKQAVATKVLNCPSRLPTQKFSSPLEKKTEINIGDYSTSLEVKVSLKS